MMAAVEQRKRRFASCAIKNLVVGYPDSARLQAGIVFKDWRRLSDFDSFLFAGARVIREEKRAVNRRSFKLRCLLDCGSGDFRFFNRRILKRRQDRLLRLRVYRHRLDSIERWCGRFARHAAHGVCQQLFLDLREFLCDAPS